ncbi:MAG: hypothetical protein ACEPOV_11360 [Hyphomicrobiales bacterium]
MKKTFTLILFAFITIIAIGQNNKTKSTTEKEFEIIKGQYNGLIKKYETLENRHTTATKELNDLRTGFLKDVNEENHKFVNNIYLWGSAILAIISFILGFFNMKTKKEIKEKIEEYKTQLTNESYKELDTHKLKLEENAKKEIEAYKNEIVIQCSKLLNENPFHIKELIEERISDYEVKQNNKIQIVYHKDEIESMNKLYKQLKFYGFNLGNSIPYSDYKQIPYNDYSEDIIYFIQDNNKKDESNKKPIYNTPTNLCLELNNGNHNNTPLQKCNIFYQGDSHLTFKTKQQNFAKTPTTIYNNLMDLLRYVEYEKKIKSKETVEV